MSAKPEGDLSAARGHCEESLQMFRSIYGDRPLKEKAVTLELLGVLCRLEGDLSAARGHCEESLQMLCSAEAVSGGPSALQRLAGT